MPTDRYVSYSFCLDGFTLITCTCSPVWLKHSYTGFRPHISTELLRYLAQKITVCQSDGVMWPQGFLPHSTSSSQHTFLFCFSTSGFHQTAVQAWFYHRVSQYQVTIQHLQTVLNRLSGENKSRMRMIEKVWFMANCWWSSVFEHEKNRKISMLNISSTTCNGSWGCYMSASYFLLILCI